jgi:hypothetical protein
VRALAVWLLIAAATMQPRPVGATQLAPIDDRIVRTGGEWARRPTDGAADPRGDGYSVPSRFLCRVHVCVHWVATTTDAPPPLDRNGNGVPDEVDLTLEAINNAWRVEVDRLRFRAPMSDMSSMDHGPDGRLDVYLADIGAEDLAGYTASDDPHANDGGYPFRTYSAYVVVDNDFSFAQLGTYGGPGGLKATAAHELFHAVQYAYDAGEDPWLMEGSAVWMEDQVADDVNANRSRLGHSPMSQPWVPIDSSRGLHEYGAWIFWRYLSESLGGRGVSLVRRVWEVSADGPGDPNLFSARAVARVLASRGRSLASTLAGFAVWNLAPSRFYAEGSAYPAAPVTWEPPLTANHQATGWRTVRVDHMATAAVAFSPGSGDPTHGSIRLSLDAPPTATAAAARVAIFFRSGAIRIVPAALNDLGDVDLRLPFGRATVSHVVLFVANAGTDFRCWTGGGYSCNGRSRDDRMPFSYLAALVR